MQCNVKTIGKLVLSVEHFEDLNQIQHFLKIYSDVSKAANIISDYCIRVFHFLKRVPFAICVFFN